ncbi:MAG: hypothetical protein AB8G11_21335, partial [Saprospiraceae bacterium]
MTKTKHLVSTTMHKMVCKTNCMVRTNWFKWSVLGVVVWLIFSKNINFQISVGENPANIIEKHQIDDQPKVVQTTMALDKPVSKVTTTSRELGSPPGKSKPKTDGNQANDFS